MRRTGLLLGLVFSVAVGAAACSRAAEDRADQQRAALAERGAATGDEITVTGCLTSAPDRAAFVVTANRDALVSGALHAGSGETPTYTYELTGNTADLSAHVNQQVQVTGRVDKGRDDQVKVNEEDKTKLPERQSGDDKVTPAIKTDAEMDINIRRLHVSAVTPTGRACAENRQ